jgi:RES domain-containing protein
MGRVAPLKGIYFRSVEYQYMDPRDVLSGRGAQRYGGRFAPVATRAVYLSATDAGASKEVTARKTRLGGSAQISTDKYPRVVYAIAVNLKKALDLSGLGASQIGEEVRRACLAENDLSSSMELGNVLVAEGIEGLIFPSVVGGDDNLVVFQSNCGRSALTIQNEQQVIDQAKRIAEKHR